MNCHYLEIKNAMAYDDIDRPFQLSGILSVLHKLNVLS